MAKSKSKSQMRDEKMQAITELHKILRPGDKILCILRHVSRSGMSRTIDLQVLATDSNGKPWIRMIGSLAARAMGDRYDYNKGGIVVGGCGMDMGFHLVYSLGRTLWPGGYGCIGEGCPSNDHSNGDRDYTRHGSFQPHNAVMLPSGLYDVDSQTARHWHTDGGYALRHEWL